MDVRKLFEAQAIDDGWSHSDINDKCSEGCPHEFEYRHTGLQDDWEQFQKGFRAAHELLAKDGNAKTEKG